MIIEQKVLTRQQLYELVWSEPMTKLAVQFGMSDVGLKKICIKNVVPVPPRGYWRKVEVGKRVNPAPKLRGSADQQIILNVYGMPESTRQILASESVMQRMEIEGQEKIVVPQSLEKPHPLTKLVRQNLRPPRDDRYGALVCRGQNVPNVRISKPSLDRGLRILDTIFKATTSRRFEFKPGKSEHYCMSILVHGEPIGFSVDERFRQEAHRLTEEEKRTRDRGGYIYPPSYDYIPSGELTIKLEGVWGSGLQTVWKDTSKAPLEGKISELMIGLVNIAEWLRADRLRQEEEARIREEERAGVEKRREEQRTEAKSVEALFHSAKAWKKAEQLREFVAAVERCGSTVPAAILGGKSISEWLAWALAQADRLDPLVPSPPSILDEKIPESSRW